MSSSSAHKISQPRSSNPEKTVVFTFGRFQPPHIGHALLIRHLHEEAARRNATPYVIVSSSCNEKWFTSKIYKEQQKNNTFKSCARNENPLTTKRRIYYLRKMFPDTKFLSAAEYGPNIFEVIGNLANPEVGGYTKFVGVFGSDRAPTFQKMFDKAEESSRKKKEENPDDHLDPIHIDIVSIGDRDDSADDVRGASATKMREAAVANTPASREYFIAHSQIGNMTIEDTSALMKEIRDVLWEDIELSLESSPESPPKRAPRKIKEPSTTPTPPTRRSSRLAKTTGGKPKVIHAPPPPKYKLRPDEKNI
jgi:nicotinic acid mononucleotide adenylyltransferase